MSTPAFQSEHDAVAAARLAFERAQDRYNDLCLGGADDWVIQEAETDMDNVQELYEAVMEIHQPVK